MVMKYFRGTNDLMVFIQSGNSLQLSVHIDCSWYVVTDMNVKIIKVIVLRYRSARPYMSSLLQRAIALNSGKVKYHDHSEKRKVAV